MNKDDIKLSDKEIAIGRRNVKTKILVDKLNKQSVDNIKNEKNIAAPIKKVTKKYNYTKKTGRPKIQLDYDKIYSLAQVMATYIEIADILGVSVSKLENDAEFKRIYKKGTNTGRTSLRRYQFIQAQTNPTMAIWLGKQWLGQKDIPESEDDKVKVFIKNDLPKIINDNLRDDPDEDLEV